MTVQMTTKRSPFVQSIAIQALLYKDLATQLNVPTTRHGVEIGQFVYLVGIKSIVFFHSVA